MRYTSIEFGECLKDSPKFRDYLEHEEALVEHLEQKLEKTIKLCAAAVDSGKEYIKNQSAFATSLTELQSHFQDDRPASNSASSASASAGGGQRAAHSALGKIIECVQEMNKFHTTLLDQASRTVLKNLREYIRTDIREVKDYRLLFAKVSESLDGALTRNAQVNKTRLPEVTESSNYLAAATSCFRHTALDYVNLLIMLRSKKMPEILWTLMSYYQACSTFYHQGSDLCNDHEPFFKALADDINEMRRESKQLEKNMQNRHMSVSAFVDVQSLAQSQATAATDSPADSATSYPDAGNPTSTTTASQMEGYLFKRTSKGFKTWNRRWFYLTDTNKLMYRKRGGNEAPSVMEEDLRICTVRPINDSDRRFCFEVISPTKSHTLQADSADMLSTWMAALHRSIGAAIQSDAGRGGPADSLMLGGGGGASRPGSIFDNVPGGAASAARAAGAGGNFKKIAWEQFLKIPGNHRCCDCGHPEPRWASINLGITLCIHCSGVHRSLGVHHSKVRSLTLDAWEPEIVKVMMELGNQIVNRVYEARFDETDTGGCGVQRATENCERSVREAWIRSKYVDKRFVRPLVGGVEQGLEAAGGCATAAAPGLVSPVARRWSVRRLRRRPNSRSRQRSPTRRAATVAEQEEEVPASTGQPPQLVVEAAPAPQPLDAASGAANADASPLLNAIDEDGKSTQSSNSGGSVVVIGRDLAAGSVLKAELALSSDQESTGDDEEDEEAAGDEEDIANLNPNLLLYKSSAVHNLPVMCQALASGANKLWRNEADRKRTPLHQAVLSGSIMACEYLLLNGIPIDVADEAGCTALHLATEKGCTSQAFLLLKHRAKYDSMAKDGRRPIDIAIEQANADIVTLLRLTALNEEIGLQEHGTGEGDTYNDVMKDFSQRLQRSPKQGEANASNSNNSSSNNAMTATVAEADRNA